MYKTKFATQTYNEYIIYKIVFLPISIISLRIIFYNQLFCFPYHLRQNKKKTQYKCLYLSLIYNTVHRVRGPRATH